jgi:hypothetical protein
MILYWMRGWSPHCGAAFTPESMVGVSKHTGEVNSQYDTLQNNTCELASQSSSRWTTASTTATGSSDEAVQIVNRTVN